MSPSPATGALPVAASPFTMRGSVDAAVCEGDSCLVPGASAVDAPAADDSSADASAAADLARVRDAIDAGLAI
ncbi:hypothetical protein ACR8AL_12630 [Clavibacter sepedonicus]|uniref:Uncharacterized protein n=1 Tax=Clavibacter sepedonicus TaxID=31964 RepID=B0RBC4_CLASE|nr:MULTISPECIES: hypothetical protein [Clavibacter]MBD5380912.1 hypothetical protein [Clavibacter sp.]OQJ47353.1 hypothetical protein B5P19_02950 [Clavibacter sepedonicus]OQJ52909.1 hypothetical protein B5P20_01210 [Clavibacter sepedonicus]UUK66908.1 hypothetical protein LRE50_06815 [Clavibacter sepedonicus]CAQ01665.1 hypothetical protein CMS1554 [Clavibacter sepedonicus]